MEVTEEHLNIYFGKNSNYYIDRWREYKNGKVISFKPYAFLFGLFWFLYRKMYGITLLIILVLFVEGMLEEYLLTDILKTKEDRRKIIDFVAMFIIPTFSGMFGNYLYMKSSEQKIKEILAKELSEEEKFGLLEKKGGTSWAYLVLIGAMIAAFVAINNLTK